MISRILGSRISGNQVAAGIVAAVLAAMCYGFSQFLARQIVSQQGVPSLVVASFALLTGFIVLSALSTRAIRQDRRAPRKGIVFMALAGLAASAGVGFNYTALGLAPVVIVAPLSAANPLVSLALAHFFLQRMERITRRIWTGAAMVVGGVVLVTIGSVQ